MPQSEKDSPIFRIHYRDPKDGNIYALKAKNVTDSPLGLSFVRIADFVFETDTLVVQPSEEQLQKRLEGVKSLHLSLYSIISIEELGPSPKGLTFKNDKSNLVVFPNSDKG